MQKARAGQRVEPEVLAKYTASRAFLFAEYVGALIMVASFTILYYFSFGPTRIGEVALLIICLAIFAIGAIIYWQSKKIWESLDFPYRKGWHVAAIVIAGSAAFFWLLLTLLIVLAASGVNVLPE